MIHKIESENQKADIFTEGLQGELFVSIVRLLCGCQSFILEGV